MTSGMDQEAYFAFMENQGYTAVRGESLAYVAMPLRFVLC